MSRLMASAYDLTSRLGQDPRELGDQSDITASIVGARYRRVCHAALGCAAHR
jgi:hypothetical protein